jgi:SAM-dependent methyltransferase
MPTEKTFTSYTQQQGANYAKNRDDYHPNLYKSIIDHHTSTGGQLNTLLDVGCGPGTVACALAPQFAHVIGLDPSQGMIDHARSLAVSSSTSEPIRFEVSSAEALGLDLTSPIGDSSVDLITAAAAAHWFDMARFWPEAARVLKPGGTVAIWSVGDSSVHPSMPNAAAIQAFAMDLNEREIRPFVAPGNLLMKELYVDLPLPWTLTPPIPDFDDAMFRKEWGPDTSEDFFVSGPDSISMDRFERIMSTMSPITRWRDAHPDAVDTDDDIVKIWRRGIERLLHEAGVEKGKEMYTGSMTAVLLMVKKKA